MGVGSVKRGNACEGDARLHDAWGSCVENLVGRGVGLDMNGAVDAGGHPAGSREGYGR